MSIRILVDETDVTIDCDSNAQTDGRDAFRVTMGSIQSILERQVSMLVRGTEGVRYTYFNGRDVIYGLHDGYDDQVVAGQILAAIRGS